MTKPLDGVRIVDLSQLTSGPLATMILAEQGAEVIKVEPIGIGDLFRLASFTRGGQSSLILNHSRGKRSIAVDTSTEDGRAVVRELMEGADVVVQNFRPGVVDRLGLGYDDVRVTNPGVIYVSISGYGPDGPYADRPVVDPIIQALTGIVNRQQSEAIPLPDLVRNIIVDKATALTVAQAVSAALYRRTISGTGDHLVVPMLDTGLAFFWPDGMMDHTLVGDGVAGGRTLADTYSITHCADGSLIYYAATDAQRHGLYRSVGHPEWCDDPRFSSVMGLLEGDNSETLGGLLESAFAALSVDDVVPALIAAEVPVAPILSPPEVLADPQVCHNGAVVEWEHPTAGRIRQPRPPVRFASAETPLVESAPALGEHTDAILAELGRDPETIAALRAANVVAG